MRPSSSPAARQAIAHPASLSRLLLRMERAGSYRRGYHRLASCERAVVAAGRAAPCLALCRHDRAPALRVQVNVLPAHVQLCPAERYEPRWPWTSRTSRSRTHEIRLPCCTWGTRRTPVAADDWGLAHKHARHSGRTSTNPLDSSCHSACRRCGRHSYSVRLIGLGQAWRYSLFIHCRTVAAERHIHRGDVALSAISRLPAE